LLFQHSLNEANHVLGMQMMEQCNFCPHLELNFNFHEPYVSIIP